MPEKSLPDAPLPMLFGGKFGNTFISVDEVKQQPVEFDFFLQHGEVVAISQRHKEAFSLWILQLVMMVGWCLDDRILPTINQQNRTRAVVEFF